MEVKVQNQKIRIRLKGYDHYPCLNRLERAVVSELPAPMKGMGQTPEQQAADMLTSIAVTYASVCQYKRLIDIIDPSSSTVDSLMRMELPAGVDIEIKL